MSGKEMVYAVISETVNINLKTSAYNVQRSKEYWTGWSISYYQWYSENSFKEINDNYSLDKILSMYPQYHEMDIMQFVDVLKKRA